MGEHGVMNYIEKFSLFVVTLKVYILADLEPAQFLYIYNSGQLSSWCNPRKYSTTGRKNIGEHRYSSHNFLHNYYHNNK